MIKFYEPQLPDHCLKCGCYNYDRKIWFKRLNNGLKCRGCGKIIRLHKDGCFR